MLLDKRFHLFFDSLDVTAKQAQSLGLNLLHEGGLAGFLRLVLQRRALAHEAVAVAAERTQLGLLRARGFVGQWAAFDAVEAQCAGLEPVGLVAQAHAFDEGGGVAWIGDGRAERLTL